MDNERFDGSGKNLCRITDLGLAKPANEVATANKIYGVMPYVALEILKGQPYTQASDIYSLGIITYELLTCLPPFANQPHGLGLSLKICRGERPRFPKSVKYPQILVDLITKCWDSEPNNRPTARKIMKSLEGEEIYQQMKEAEEFNQTLPEEIRYPNCQSLEKVWHSKPINTQQITKKLQQIDSGQLDLDVNDFNLEELNIQDPKEQSSIQAQIEIPPKK